MFIRKFGQEYHQICVTDSYQEVHDNYDTFDEHTGLHSAFAMESFGDAVTKIASSNGTIIVEKTVLVTADLSVPANVSIDIRKGGSFAVSADMTLTILGAVNTNGQSFGSVFSGLGTVVSNAKGVFNEIYSGLGLLPGGSAQSIYAESVAKNFEIGTRRVVDDRVFRYCKAGTNMRELIPALCGVSQIEVNTEATQFEIGTYEVVILDVAARDENWYSGGYLWIMYYDPAGTGIGMLHRIRFSEASSGTSVKLTLWDPLIRVVTATTWTTVWANIYSNCRTEDLPKASMIAMPLIQVTAGKYFWGQTWGPCFAHCGYHPGSKDYDRELYFKANLYGFLPGSEVNFNSDIIPQRAGFLIPNTAVIGTDNFFMLQLSP